MWQSKNKLNYNNIKKSTKKKKKGDNSTKCPVKEENNIFFLIMHGPLWHVLTGP